MYPFLVAHKTVPDLSGSEATLTATLLVGEIYGLPRGDKIMEEKKETQQLEQTEKAKLNKKLYQFIITVNGQQLEVMNITANAAEDALKTLREVFKGVEFKASLAEKNCYNKMEFVKSMGVEITPFLMTTDTSSTTTAEEEAVITSEKNMVKLLKSRGYSISKKK